MLAFPAAAAGDACPENLPASKFTDLAGLSPETTHAINCVSSYSVAKGTSDTAFDPASSVTRWQMALFLTRTAAAAGITLPTAASQGFTDIGSLPADTQAAINQLAQLGITTGTTSTTFSPELPVSRWQMALFLVRLAAKAEVAVPAGTDQGFLDISSLPSATRQAINQLAGLGVAKGTSATTFTPGQTVVRWQMALFLARSFGVLGVKPGGLSVAASAAVAQVTETVTLNVVANGLDGKPLAGKSIDVWVGSKDAAGKCVVDTDAKLAGVDAGTGTDCVIDTADPKTDKDGKVKILFTHSATPEIDTVYVWTGEVAAEFGSTVSPVTVQVTWVPPISGIVVSAPSPVRYGTSTTVTARLTDSGGNTVPVVGQTIVLSVKRGSVPIATLSGVTTESGTAPASYLGPPDPTGGDDAVTVDTITAFWDKDKDGVDDGATEPDSTTTAGWDDTLPLVTQAAITQSAASGLAGSSTSATITVRDKFGVPISGARIVFTITGFSTATPAGVTTNTSGQAGVTYSGNGSGNGADTINASVDLDAGGSIETGSGDLASVTAIYRYWVELAPTLGTGVAVDLISVNTTAKTIDVSNGSWYYRLTYDSDDTFNVGVALTDLAGFEAALSAKAAPAVGGAAELTVDYAVGIGANLFRLSG